MVKFRRLGLDIDAVSSLAAEVNHVVEEEVLEPLSMSGKRESLVCG